MLFLQLQQMGAMTGDGVGAETVAGAVEGAIAG